MHNCCLSVYSRHKGCDVIIHNTHECSALHLDAHASLNPLRILSQSFLIPLTCLSRLSPDAFFIHLHRYQRRHNKPAPTYEACSTRQYFHGRTETIRSCSPEANAWVRSVLDDQSHEEQRKALAAATKAQGGLARSAAGGMGVDRHLLGLSVLASEGGMTESDEAGKLFKDPIFSHSSTWALSTSNVSSPWLDLFGFGAVCSHGYGLGYMITDDNIPIHITSWNENADTSTQGMKGEIVAALEHIQTIMGAEQ